MQTEDFYRKIQQKIEEEPLSSEFLAWNQEAVWERIEQRQNLKKSKRMIVWWQSAVAASVVLGLIFGGYFLKNSSSSETPVLVENFSKNIVEMPTASSINEEPKLSVLPINSSKIVQKPKQTATVQAPENISPLATKEPEPTVASNNYPLPATTTIVADIPAEKPIEKAEPANTEIAENEVVAEPKRVERTVILDIPDYEENNRFQPVQKRPFMARFFKQVGKFNTEGKVDWEELNMKPNRIWAYVKESMKTDKRDEK